MVIFELFSKSLKIKYKNSLCSKATLFTLLAGFIAISFPFIVVYRSRGLWIKHDTFYEQPNIRFKGEYLFIGYTDNLSTPIVCSNFPYYQMYSSYDKCSIIKVREIDNNLDGKVDELDFNLNVNIPENAKLLSIDLLMTIDYRLQTTCPLNMQSAIILQESLHNFVSVLDITSHLQLLQTYPLFCYSKGNDIYYNQSVIQNSLDLKNYRFQEIIKEYNKRNISTHLTNTYKTIDIEDQSSFEVHLRIHYPQHRIYYRPGFWQVIKWAWIQYFAVYIVFAWFIKRIKQYVFENKLVLFYEMSPLKEKR